MANKAMISDSLLDNMERKLTELQSKQRQHDAHTPPSAARTPAAAAFGGSGRTPGGSGGADATSKYNDLQKQMDQMLGMVRSESDNVRQIENSLYKQPQTSAFHNDPPGPSAAGESFGRASANPRFQSGDLMSGSGGAAGFPDAREMEMKLTSILNRSRNQAPGTTPSAESAEVKAELEGVIAGLSDYLNHMRHELERLRKENERFKLQMAETKRKFTDLEGENKQMLQDKASMAKLGDEIRELYVKLESSQYNNEELKKELSKYPDLSTIETLRQAERDCHGLRDTLKAFREEAHADKESMMSQLKAEKRRSDEMHKKIVELEAKEKELANVQIQLASTNASREALRDQLSDMQNTYRSFVETSIKPEELLRHVQEMTANVDRMSGEVRPFHENDVSGKALSDLQKVVNGKFQENLHAIESVKKMLEESRQDCKELEEELALEQEKHRKSREHAAHQRNQDKTAFEDKTRQWQDEIKRVRDRAEMQRDQFEAELSRLESERRDLDKQLREAEKDVLRREVSDSEKYDRMQKELSELTAMMKTSNESHSSEVAGYEKCMADYEARCANYERKVSELEKGRALLERDLARSNLEGEQLGKQLQEVIQKLQNEQNNCENYQETVGKMREEESRLKSLIKSQKEDIAKLSSLFEKALEGGVHNEEITRLTGEIGNLQNYISGQDDTIQKLSEELRKAEGAAQQPRFVRDSESGDVLRCDDPNSGIFCNVLQHHNQEDQINHLKSKLLKASRNKKVESSLKKSSRELDKVLIALETAKAELNDVDEQKQAGIKKLRTVNEKVDFFLQCVREVSTRPDAPEYFFGRASSALPTEVCEALKKYDAISEDLSFLENLVEQKRAESTKAEKKLIEFEAQLDDIQMKTKGVIKQYGEAKKHLSGTQQQAKKLVEQVHETRSELGNASASLASIKKECEDFERKKRDLEDDLKDINQIIARKNLEYQNLERKAQKVRDNAEDMRTTEDELFGHLKASEKALNERKLELQSLQAQAQAEAREVQDIEADLIRKRTELQNVKEELSAKQAELSNVLKEGEEDLNKKTRDIRDSKTDLETIQASIAEYEKLAALKKRELDELREKVSLEETNYQNAKNSLMTSNQELKNLRDLISNEKVDLENMRAKRDDYTATTLDF